MRIDHSWVPWMRELVTKIAESGESYLVEKAKAVEWFTDDVALLRYGDENIDPLSFMYFLARDRGDDKLHSELKSVHKVFDIEAEYPESVLYIPRPNGLNTLFHFRGEGRPDLIWRLFRDAAHSTPKISGSDFDETLNMKGVKIKKLTQTLYIVNPYHFLPADDHNEVLPSLEFQEKVRSYAEYLARKEAVRRHFPGCEFYEIDTFLNIQNRSRLINRGSKFFHINSNVYGDKLDYWERYEPLPKDALTFKEQNIVYIGEERKRVKDPKSGDIIFVRFGSNEGRGIGVVGQNGYYPDGWSPEKRISVYWINKQSEYIGREGVGNISFRKIKTPSSTYNKIRESDAYKISFNLIEKLQNGGEVQPNNEAESRAREMTQMQDDGNALNTILFGPPGTGKTYEAVSHAVAIIEGKDPAELTKSELRKQVKERFDKLKEQGQIEFVTFHQNYTYEDFIEGIRPMLRRNKSTGEDESASADGNQNELIYDLHDGIFKKISQQAEDDDDNRYVLIIDEINRGNIAKIFGELITLVEPSKRLGEEDAARATLPYSGESFGVPNNLYILGTMNTADRGVAPLDTALRRRFHFLERMPNPTWLQKPINGVDGQKLLTAINARIKAKLDREHQIGHTYLIGVKNINALADAFQRSILPLLQEYFYDDWGKIQYVLNDNPFVRKDPSAPKDSDADRPMLELLPHDDARWRQAESYQQIYASSGGEEGNDGG